MPLSPRASGLCIYLSVKKHRSTETLGLVALAVLYLALHSAGSLSKQSASKRSDAHVAVVLSRMRASEHCRTDYTRPPGYGAVLAIISSPPTTIIHNSCDYIYLLPRQRRRQPSLRRRPLSRIANCHGQQHHPRSSRTEDAVHAMRNTSADPRSLTQANIPMRIAHTVDIQPTGNTALWRIEELT